MRHGRSSPSCAAGGNKDRSGPYLPAPSGGVPGGLRQNTTGISWFFKEWFAIATSVAEEGVETIDELRGKVGSWN